MLVYGGLIARRTANIPGYVASSFSSFFSLARTSAGSSSGALLGVVVALAAESASAPSFSPLFFSPAVSASSPSLLDVLPCSSPFSLFAVGGSASPVGGGLGVVARLMSSSSMTKAASKTAGSGFTRVSTLEEASLETSLLGFLARGRLAAEVDAELEAEFEAPLAERDRGGLLGSARAFWRACSSAMVRSIAPLILYRRQSVSQSD